jgi:hypothetical protein
MNLKKNNNYVDFMIIIIKIFFISNKKYTYITKRKRERERERERKW